MKKIYIFSLVLILLVSFSLRFYKVTENPPALNWDEISIAYNADSILKTGKDEWGRFFPIHFKSYGEYKLPAQIYASIPGIYFFGLTEFGVRITPVLYGTLTILIVFLLGRKLFKNSLVGLISAFLLGISPWHIHLTRASFESSFAVFWICLGIWLLLKGFSTPKWFIVSMIPFALSIYTYNSARVFTPLFLFTTLIIYRKDLLKYKKVVLTSILLFFILLLPLIPFVLSGDRSARYKLVSITDDPGLVPRINENRGHSSLPQPFAKLVHNKITYVAFYATRNYLVHFTPQFLFISGAPHKQHHVQNIGELYYFQAPFLLIGLISLFYLKYRFKGLLLSWILLVYVPVAVTNDSIPHALRTLIAVPSYQFVSAFGFWVSLKFINSFNKSVKIFISVVLIITIIFSISLYLYQYYAVYPKLYSRDWQYGYKQVISYIKQHKGEYDEIVFTRHFGEPHMFTLFYMQYDPEKYQNNQNLVRFETHDWVRVLRFDNFYFPDLGDKGTKYEDIVSQNKDKKLLFIGKNGDFPHDKKRLEIINFLNGDEAFEIVENK